MTSKRINNPERTASDIIAIATREFAEKGYAGARIDDIAASTQTSKRMIYYYFENKDGLYLAVLEDAYRRIRSIEASLHIEALEPREALRKLVSFTMDYHSANPDFIRLVMGENIERGAFLARSKAIRSLNTPAIDSLRALYQRGLAAGVFRPGIDPLDLHQSISALAFYNVSNRHTFVAIFGRDMGGVREQARRRETVIEMIMRYVCA